MRRLKYLFLAAPLALLTFNSCESDEQIDTLIDTVERGAILRTVSLISNELPIGVTTAEFSVELEEQDQENGALLQSVDVFVTFNDGSEDEGDSSGGIVGQEVAAGTISADQFTTGPNGLPRTTLTLPLTQLLSLVNLTNDDIFGGDTFVTRLVLNLTDGRSFTNTDVNGNVASGSFFVSPFIYTTRVVCPVEAGTFVGDYNVEQVTSSIFGYDTFDPDGGGVILTLVEGDEDGIAAGTIDTPEVGGTQRAFDADYLAALGFGNTVTYLLNYVCGVVTLNPAGFTGVACGGVSIELGVPLGPPGVYDFQDDSSFVLVILDDVTNSCGTGSPDVTLNWSRQ